MAGPSSPICVDSDSTEFLSGESDTDISSESELSENVQLVISDSDYEDMDDEDYIEVFSPEDPLPLPFDYQEIPGPKHMPPSDSPPITYFDLLFTTSLFSLIVKETNRNAKQFFAKRSENVSLPVKIWENVNLEEIKGFIACIMNMGIIKKPTIKLYWSTTSSQNTPWFGKMFSKHRFADILRFFHLVNDRNIPKSNEQGYDPCARYQPLLEHANNLFCHYYIPHQQISIDESLVGTKNRTSLMQYLPNKDHYRWGIKFWMMCDSISNYCLGFYAYMGAKNQKDKEEMAKNGLGYMVVMKLLKIGNYLRKGYHLFVDNFFMSMPLVRDLFSQDTYITGTLRKNQKYLLPQLKQKYGVGQTKYVRSKNVLVCASRMKKSQKEPVVLLSSKARATESEIIVTRSGREKTSSKPDVIEDYNKYMGGIDNSDMMLYYYLDDKRTIKYWKKVTFNIIARMVLNSYILYKENSGPWVKIMTRLQFTINIIEEIGSEWMEFKSRHGADDFRISAGFIKLPGRNEKQCCVCSTNKKRKRSRTICKRCKKGLHPVCFPKHKC